MNNVKDHVRWRIETIRQEAKLLSLPGHGTNL